MALSIGHRVTGIGLALGLVLLVWWLVALASGPAAFATVQAVMDSWIGALVLFGFTFAVLYHLANGIRHLAWDLGYGFDLGIAASSGIAVLAIAGAATILIWLVIVLGG